MLFKQIARNLGVRDFCPALTGAVKLRRKKGGRELPHSKPQSLW